MTKRIVVFVHPTGVAARFVADANTWNFGDHIFRINGNDPTQERLSDDYCHKKTIPEQVRQYIADVLDIEYTPFAEMLERRPFQRTAISLHQVVSYLEDNAFFDSHTVIVILMGFPSCGYYRIVWERKNWQLDKIRDSGETIEISKEKDSWKLEEVVTEKEIVADYKATTVAIQTGTYNTHTHRSAMTHAFERAEVLDGKS